MAIVVVSGNAAGFAQDIEAGQHRLAADEQRRLVGRHGTVPLPLAADRARCLHLDDPRDVCQAEAVAA
jgi:hypothetical protein